MKLYIIGNGFDLAHELDTRYSDFREFLEEQDWDFLSEFEKMFGYYNNFNSELVEERLWRDFETNLAYVDETSMVEAGMQMEMGLESGDIGIEDTLDDHWESEFGFVKKLNEFVFSWINEIDIDVEPKIAIGHFKSDDKFINFNYTELLENVYGVESYQIVHMHGSTNEDDYEPIIGHGERIKIDEAKQEVYDARENFDEKRSSIMNAVANYYENTLKDVNYYLSMNRSFIGSLSQVEEVIVLGHSLGNVDMPYFESVKRNVEPNTKWTITYYSENSKQELLDKVLMLGIEEVNINMIKSDKYFEETQIINRPLTNDVV